MPRAWTDKDERQYKHIRNSAESDGKNPERAKEIAARTVNKQRREEDRTPSSRAQGTGNPEKGLEARSKTELYNRARQLNIKGRSGMNKDALLQAIRRAR